MILIKTLNKLDFKEWIESGKHHFLNSTVISKKRAWSLANNPDAQDNDVLMVIAIINNEIIGFRNVFPEIIDNGKNIIKIGWFGTSFVDERYRGNNIAKQMMNPLTEKYQNILGVIQSSENAIKSYIKLNWKVEYIDFEYLYLKIPKSNKKKPIFKLINYLSPIFNEILSLFQIPVSKKLKSQQILVNYVSYIDSEIFGFILKCQKKDKFPKSQEMLNWILSFPWGEEAPLISKVKDDYYFSSYLEQFKQYAYTVQLNNLTIGFVMIRLNNGRLSVPFIYMDNNFKNNIFDSIIEHCIKFNATSIYTSNQDLINYIKSMKLLIKFSKKVSVSYCYSNEDVFDLNNKVLQDGDGDLFF